MRVILQGGWTIDKPVLWECLKLTGIAEIHTEYLEWHAKNRNRRTVKFDATKLSIL